MLARHISRIQLPTSKGVYATCHLWKQEKISRFMSGLNSPDDSDIRRSPPLKQWRRPWDTGQEKLQTKFKALDRGGGRPSMDLIVLMNQAWKLNPSIVRKWWHKKQIEMEIHDQRFVKQRHDILGSNLAAAHFLVFRGAKVKFVGRSEWIEKDKDEKYNLPSKYEPNYVIEAIDIDKMNLHYEGLENMRYLHQLKWLSLKGCKTIDDWCLDRLSTMFMNLEYLDLSDCKNVSERGLEALYRTQSLKKLIVTNHYASPAFELTCMMLEDGNKKLVCDIKLPNPELAPGEAKT